MLVEMKNRYICREMNDCNEKGDEDEYLGYDWGRRKGMSGKGV